MESQYCDKVWSDDLSMLSTLKSEHQTLANEIPNARFAKCWKAKKPVKSLFLFAKSWLLTAKKTGWTLYVVPPLRWKTLEYASHCGSWVKLIENGMTTWIDPFFVATDSFVYRDAIYSENRLLNQQQFIITKYNYNS